MDGHEPPAIERLSRGDVSLISTLLARSESNKREGIFRWPGRRPTLLVRFFISLLVANSVEEALLASLGVQEALARISERASGLSLYDPFAGSGTIPIEAAKLGFYAVGQDVNPYAVSVAQAQASLCTGECRLLSSCLWEAMAKSWDKVKHLWCRGDECVVHILLARCPPCRAPVWVSSKRSSRGPRRVLVLREDLSLEWTTRVHGLGPREPSVEVPGWLPREHPHYVAYALEVYSQGERRWVSLAVDREWRGWVEETGTLAREAVESIPGVRIPLLEETRRLYRRGILDARLLFTWRQLYSLSSFTRSGGQCRRLAALLAANATPSNSLLAIYYQPLAKVNPGMVVKSFWMPRNPVTLNPFAHRQMPGRPGAGSRPVGRGTLLSLVSQYASACGEVECRIPPTIVVGDSTSHAPVRRVDHVVTDPPYPGLHTYRDLSLPYAQISASAGMGGGLEWNEIDTRDPEVYVDMMKSSLSLAARLIRHGGYMVLFVSAHKIEYIQALAEVLAYPASRGLGLRRIYPVLGEAPGRLGRGMNKLVFVAAYRKGYLSRPDALEPLSWADEVASSYPIGEEEREYSARVAGALASILEGVYLGGLGKYSKSPDSLQ